MNKLDELYNILEQQLKLYESFLAVEEEKYNVIIIDDVNRLDEIVSEEQAFFLKSKGLESKREKLMKDLGQDKKTLKQLIEVIDDSEKSKFLPLHEKLYYLLAAFKQKNNECQELVKMRLHRAQQMMAALDAGNNQNRQYVKNGSTDELDINKINIISRKI